MHIAFCCDRNYVMPTGVAMISVCESNAGSKLSFHVVLTEGTPEDVASLKQIAQKYDQKLTIYPLSNQDLMKYSCLGSAHVSVTGFARILLPDLMSQDIHRVIYLDSDIAVVKSLSELWNMEMSNCDPMGAVVDVDGIHPTRRIPLQTPLNIPYCNSGVLIMNLDCWRKEGLTATICQAAEEHRFPLLDQDVLHYVLQDRVLMLPVKYNVQLGFFTIQSSLIIDYHYIGEIAEALDDPTVIHYSTISKPWRGNNCPYHEIWKRFLDMSPWADFVIPESKQVGFEETKAGKELIDAYQVFPKQFGKEASAFVSCYMSVVRLRHSDKLFKVLRVVASMVSKLADIIYNHNLKKLQK